MRIYISGPITGNPQFREQFAEAEREIEAAGHEAVNPASDENQSRIVGKTRREIMDYDLGMLAGCDGVLLLEGWHSSPGALEEQLFAVTHDIPVASRLSTVELLVVAARRGGGL